jgi:EmrB/QacA subfamily drug resistance transporter
MTLDHRARWIALFVISFGNLMIVVDMTVVNVALPSIREDLGFSQASLAWVVNAYAITYAGFMLLGGRLGDLLGRRRLYIIGIAVFTLASLACGAATSSGWLVAARAVQGLGGAFVSAVGLSLIVGNFPDRTERVKAMGVWVFMMTAGSAFGVLLGGVISDTLGWQWIFLVNPPIGAVVIALCLLMIPRDRARATTARVDLAGAVTITGALLLLVYAIVNGNQDGWASPETIGRLCGAGALLAAFVVIESRVEDPLVPLRIFRLRNTVVACTILMLGNAGNFGWFFLLALYLQLVLGFSPLQIGLAFLPYMLIQSAFALGLSPRVVARFGVRGPVALGMCCNAVALVLFARAPVDGTFLVDVLPPSVIFAVGAGLVSLPLLFAATSDADPSETGLVSGLYTTAGMMGGALGVAILASVAAARSDALLDAGNGPLSALSGGYRLAFLFGAAFALAAAVIGGTLLRTAGSARRATGSPAPTPQP